MRLDASRLTCGVVIVLAGMPRSGSTWEERMVLSALDVLGVPVGHSGYWDYARHVHMSVDNATSYYRREYVAWASLTATSVVVYKSHEYRDDLAAACGGRHIVLTSHRCMEAQVRSMARAWSPASLSEWSRILDDYDRWLHAGALDMDYDAAVVDPSRTSRRIGTWLAAALNRSTTGRTFPAILSNANPNVRPRYEVNDTALREMKLPRHPNLRSCVVDAS